MLGWSLLASAPAAAVTIGFDADSITASTGESFEIQLVVGGLAAGESLGSYVVDVGWDESHLAFGRVEFGELLGGAERTFRDAALPTSASLSVAELSLLSPAELDALQPGAFAIATLHFDVIGAGTSEITILTAFLDDAGGSALEIDSVGSARVQPPIPEPGAVLLFALGALLLRGFSASRA
jgi:hypothetical protein